MKKLETSRFSNAIIGSNVEIWCDEFSCVGAFTIGDNVIIRANKIALGNNAKIENNVTVRALRNDIVSFSMGDESLLGYNTQVLVPEYTMGDYSQVFNSCLISGYKQVTMGHNCWVGQGAILNSAETLTLGNNVRMGGSQVWTHVASGELLEGCNFYNEQPVVIEDNVWLMGFGHTISPGVTLARNSVIMAGSVVTRSTEPYKTYSGVPAVDISDKLPAWRHVSLGDKFEKLRSFTEEFVQQYPEFGGNVFCIENREQAEQALKNNMSSLLFFKQADLSEYRNTIHSVFDLSTKTYIKRRSDIEVKWMRFAIGYKARFIPFNS